jgi:peptidoglycan hydrolase-like protein with peptidoglycan-binding domain
VISTADDLNNAYYGRAVRPTEILISRNVHGPRNDLFAAELDRDTAGRPTYGYTAPPHNTPAALSPQGAPNASSETASLSQTSGIEASGAPGMRLNAQTIRAAQQALSDKGYDAGAVDGIWGPHTRAAVRKFQKAEELQRTARLDQATLQALGVASSMAQAETTDARSSEDNDRSSSTSAMSMRSNSQEIRSAQEALNDKSYDAGAVDGIFGPHTEAAVRKFQKAEALQQTGRLDRATLQALGVS